MFDDDEDDDVLHTDGWIGVTVNLECSLKCVFCEDPSGAALHANAAGVCIRDTRHTSNTFMWWGLLVCVWGSRPSAVLPSLHRPPVPPPSSPTRWVPRSVPSPTRTTKAWNKSPQVKVGLTEDLWTKVGTRVNRGRQSQWQQQISRTAAAKNRNGREKWEGSKSGDKVYYYRWLAPGASW